jgi:cellulose synthase/poly-beta-1,6-N-acetylglucosamine synthase-like glycosyltransferase
MRQLQERRICFNLIGSDSSGFPELDCLRGKLSAHVLDAAETRADRLATGADRVLIASGRISEEDYVRALAAHLGVSFVPLDGAPRSDCPLADDDMIAKASSGLLTLASGEQPAILVAPRHFQARQLARMLTDKPSLAAHLRFTTSERLNRFIMRCAGATLARRAADDLKLRDSTLSAAALPRLHYVITLFSSAAVCLFAFAPGVAFALAELALGALTIGWLGLRLAGIVLPRRRPRPLPRMRDADLPVYTVIAALYREATSVDGLLHAIAALDYPREKLDVILAVEAADKDTRAAIAARTTTLPVTVIPVPAGTPQTKPRALNAALPFAQGAFTCVFDAEDRPDAHQLRCALDAFARGGERVTCVQARLTIDNTDDGWLSAFFTAEYAGHFDVFLDGMSALRLPIPLGGSSNHFRTGVLREVGGWDAYNVTEDADLGLRLARLGYRTRMIDSSTHEEAPARLAAWLKQRTRWFKGWMQTWAVHMRSPRALWRDLGPRGFFAVQLVVGGNVIAALLHPLFLFGIAIALASGYGLPEGGGGLLVSLYFVNLLAGYLGSGVLGFFGLLRRGLLGTAWVLALTPVHWLLLSAAAWRALWQLIFAPHLWEKTEHGLARSSRLNDRTTAALLALEAELSGFERRLPVF